MDMSVTSSGIQDVPSSVSPQQVSPTSTLAGLTPNGLSSGATLLSLSTVNNTATTSCSGVMSTSTMPVKSTSGKTPTCKVCGDESSGYHYGVDSCEGCKGFFRRCITQGMNHKCSNEEKCEITPFTRNSCQFCRLKKCFAVGMSREASRLGRRPKRLKDSSGEPKRETNVPIAPYPTSPGDLYKLRMAELQKVLNQNGSFKPELMDAFLVAAKQSFREHQRNNNSNDNANRQKRPSGTGHRQVGSETASTASPALSTSSQALSPPEKAQRTEGRSQSIDAMGIIESSLDNVKIDPDSTDFTDNGLSTPPVSSVTSDISNLNYGDFPTEIKTEVDQDNSLFMLSDSMMGGFPPMSNAASPLGMMMPQLSPETLMMMPDMMEMMKDMDPSMMMMGGGMPQMPPPEMMSDMMGESDDNGNQMDVTAILDEVRQVPSELRQHLIDQVIEQVSKAHLETVTPTHMKVAEANKLFNQKKAEGLLPDFTKMKMDPRAIWQKFVSSMVYEVTQVVRFCKKLPGFSEIHQDDQIVLIKKGSFEILLNRMCLLVDHVKLEMFDPNMEMKFPKEMIGNMPMGFFIMEFFNVAAQMNPLQLTDEEIGIFSAALIMSPERETLDNVSAVEKLHSLFLQSLYFEMKKNHTDFENKFVQLLGIIPVFRLINKKHSLALNAMKMQKDPVIEEYPDLPKEIYDVDKE